MICVKRDYDCHLGMSDALFMLMTYLIQLSASVGNLQKMLDVCFEVGSRLDTVFNAVKYLLIKMGLPIMTISVN